jgi:hypothetical protein
MLVLIGAVHVALPLALFSAGWFGPANPAATPIARIQVYARGIDFDFGGWMVRAGWNKLIQASVGEQMFMSETARGDAVRAFFDAQRQSETQRNAIAAIYADPDQTDAAGASATLRAEAADTRDRLLTLQPLTEAILQEQVAVIYAEESLTAWGQPLPPVAFEVTPLPLALVVSPRERIEQLTLQLIDGDLPLDRQVALEEATARGEDVSTMVTGIGGLGLYPTMIGAHSDLNWITNVVAHEYAHNLLSLRPLGVLYTAGPEVRTMNETAATILGNEIGLRVMRRYYPDLAPPDPGFRNTFDRSQPPTAHATAEFDFRAEMRLTRVRADRLLSEGRITEAEAYMEARRRVFIERGYRIRKLNQAYFAFYGAYNAAPGGAAAGADPVGPAVQLLRRRSPSLGQFLEHIAWYTDVADLRRDLGLP